jgi:hypothetical protein
MGIVDGHCLLPLRSHWEVSLFAIMEAEMAGLSKLQVALNGAKNFVAAESMLLRANATLVAYFDRARSGEKVSWQRETSIRFTS